MVDVVSLTLLFEIFGKYRNTERIIYKQAFEQNFWQNLKDTRDTYKKCVSHVKSSQ